MATDSRREVTPDNLRSVDSKAFSLGGQSRAVPGVGGVNSPSVSPISPIYGALSKWGTNRFNENAEAKYNKSALEGQMAFQQGKSFDELKANGVDEFALQGYRLMDAETVSAGLLASQVAEIQSGGGAALSPDAYRKMWADRVEGSMQGRDAATQRLIREAAAKQIPRLVSEHTGAHAAYLEQENYNSLERSVRTLAKDASTVPDLIAFAKGEKGSNGLTPERRQAAVVSGVVNALYQGDPSAYDALESNGLFDTMDASSITKLKAARQTYESQKRSEWDEQFSKDRQAIIDSVDADGDGYAAVTKMQELYDRNGLTLGAEEANSVLNITDKVVAVKQGERGFEVEEARIRGDYETQSRAMMGALIQAESGGNPNAVSPKGAVGIAQVMPGTAEGDPNLGYPSIVAIGREMGIYGTKAELMRNPHVGKEAGRRYLEALLKRYDGDTKKALAAYNWGYGRVDKWDGRLATLPEETRNYVIKISKNLGTPINAETEYNIAKTQYDANREVVKADQFLGYQIKMEQLKEDFMASGNVEQYLTGTRAAGQEFDQARTIASANQEMAVLRDWSQQATATAKKSGEAAKIELGKQFELDSQEILTRTQKAVDAVVERGGSGAEAVAVTMAGQAELYAAAQARGVEIQPSAMREKISNIGSLVEDFATKTKDIAEQRAQIQAIGINGNLPKELHERALKDFETNLPGHLQRQQMQMAREGRSKDEIEQAMPALKAGAYNNFIARTGVVPEGQARVMSALVGGEWVDKNGEVSSNVIEAMSNFAFIHRSNPDAAKAMLNGDEGAYQKAYNTFQLAEVTGNLQAAVEIVGTGIPITERTEDEKASMQTSLGSTVVRAVNDMFATTPFSILRGDTTAKEWWDGRNVRAELFSGGIPQVTQTGTFNVSLNNRLNEDNPAIHQIRAEAARLANVALVSVPGITPNQAAKNGTRQVMERGALVGSGFIMPPSGQESIKRQMFGAEEVSNPLAPDRAIAMWLADPATEARFPRLKSMRDESRRTMGYGPEASASNQEPYSVFENNGNYFALIETETGDDIATIPLNLNEIGQAYIKQGYK